jgi:hypothetical protein
MWPFEVQRYCIQSTKPLHRRTTETGITIGVRMLQDPLAFLDAWIAKQNAPELSRLEAIRHLVDWDLRQGSERRCNRRSRRLRNECDAMSLVGGLFDFEPLKPNAIAEGYEANAAQVDAKATSGKK